MQALFCAGFCSLLCVFVWCVWQTDGWYGYNNVFLFFSRKPINNPSIPKFQKRNSPSPPLTSPSHPLSSRFIINRRNELSNIQIQPQRSSAIKHLQTTSVANTYTRQNPRTHLLLISCRIPHRQHPVLNRARAQMVQHDVIRHREYACVVC